MSNVENDLSPPLPFYLGASSVKDYLVLRPITTNLSPSVPFVRSSLLAERKCFPLYNKKSNNIVGSISFQPKERNVQKEQMVISLW